MVLITQKGVMLRREAEPAITPLVEQARRRRGSERTVMGPMALVFEKALSEELFTQEQGEESSCSRPYL